jgi:hypothetical protein
MRIFTKIRGDIRNLVLITSIIATCDYALFRTFIDSMMTPVILSPVTTTPAIIYRRCQRQPAIKHLQQNKLAYASK